MRTALNIAGRFLLILAAAACAASQARAMEPVGPTGVDILSFGIYSTQNAQVRTDYQGDVAGDEWVDVDTYTLLEQTDRIPAVKGTVFGIEFVVTGAPQGAEVEVSCAISHPEMNDGSRTFSSQTIVWSKGIGAPAHFCYGFDNDYELLPDSWTFQIIVEGRVMAEKTFTVK